MRAVLILALATACAGSKSTNSEPLSGAGALRGIDFAPRIAVMESFPIQLAGAVEITNRRSQPVALRFPSSCEALLRVYDRDGTRNAPVWDQRSVAECSGSPGRISLDPGESREVRVPTVSAYDILGDSLPDGPYRLTVYLQPSGNVIEVEGGMVDLATTR